MKNNSVLFVCLILIGCVTIKSKELPNSYSDLGETVAKFDAVQLGDTEKKVMEKLGKPNEISEEQYASTKFRTLEYKTSENSYASFAINDRGIVISLSFSVSQKDRASDPRWLFNTKFASSHFKRLNPCHSFFDQHFMLDLKNGIFVSEERRRMDTGYIITYISFSTQELAQLRETEFQKKCPQIQ